MGLAAARVFRRKGFRRALMADVASEMGVAPGTLYRYVESKEALFQLALLFGMRGHLDLDPDQLPLATPMPGETLSLLEKWLAQEGSFPVLRAALDRRAAPRDVGAELTGILEERYDLIEDHQRLLALLERSALDLPELSDVYYRQRRHQIAELARYLERRMRSGLLLRSEDPKLATRFVVETIAWFAWHRYGDPDAADIEAASARRSTVDLLARAFLGAPA